MSVSTSEERAYLKAMDAPGQAGPFIPTRLTLTPARSPATADRPASGNPHPVASRSALASPRDGARTGSSVSPAGGERATERKRAYSAIRRWQRVGVV